MVKYNSKILIVFFLLQCTYFQIMSQNNPIIIDHNSITKFNSIDEATLQKVIQFRMMFRHASIGFAISDGLDCLQGTKPQSECKVYPQYKYDRRNWSFQGRENSGWYGKIDDFTKEVELQINDFDIFSFKYCYLDGLDELAEPCGKPLSNEKIMKAFSYLRDNMEMLEAKYKDKYFVWWTVPLTQIGQICTDTLNYFIREYCKNNNKILFDIADIECHDTLGNLVTNSYGLEKAFKPYCGEQKPDAQACHPGRLGALIIAKSLWVMMTEILERMSLTNVNENLLTDVVFDFSLAPNPVDNIINFRFSGTKPKNSIINSITIINSLGIEIYRTENILNQQNLCITLSQLPQGLYNCIIDIDSRKIAKCFVVLR